MRIPSLSKTIVQQWVLPVHLGECVISTPGDASAGGGRETGSGRTAASKAKLVEVELDIVVAYAKRPRAGMKTE